MHADLTLVLDRRHLTVRLDGGTIRVERQDGSWQRVPVGLLGLVVVYGSPLVSCDVWRALAQAGVPAVFLASRGVGEPAWAGAGISANVRLRCRQHLIAARADERLKVAKNIVASKIGAQIALVLSLRNDPPRCLQSARRGLSQLTDTLESHRQTLRAARDIPSLMGTEGAASVAWYRWLGRSLHRRWRFRGRNRRPPRDPVNALLSLSYTLAMGDVRNEASRVGFDPAVGFLHGIVPGRDSLILDLVEPIRPSVDRFVLELLDTVHSPDDFRVTSAEGCRLIKTARSLFYQTWGRRRRHWPGLGTGQYRETAEAVVDDTSNPTTLAGEARRVIHQVHGYLMDKNH